MLNHLTRRALPTAALLVVAMTPPARAQRQRAATTYEARSPDGRTRIAVAVGDRVTYTVTRGGTTLLAPSPVSLTLDGGRVLGGAGARVSSAKTRRVDETIRPVAPTKNASVRDRYTELRID